MRSAYKNRYSKAEVVPATIEGAEGVFEVVRLNTISSHRGRGYASQIMQRIVDDADRCCRVLMLHPEPYGLIGITDLITFYQKCGFIVIQEYPVIMARQPNFDQLPNSGVASG